MHVSKQKMEREAEAAGHASKQNIEREAEVTGHVSKQNTGTAEPDAGRRN